MPANRNKYSFSAFLILLVICIVSCSHGRHTVYSQFVDIPSDGWAENEYCEFVTAEADSTLFADAAGRYDVILAVRHSDAYPFTDLYLSLSSSPDCKLPQELHLNLASGAGKWLGPGSHGIYTFTDTIATGVTLSPALRLKVSQAMNRPILPGILNIGLIINSSQN